jgi:hypothetical protein
MRTTIHLDDNLHKLAKEYALSHGQTFTELVENALREKLMAKADARKRAPVKLKTVGGRGLHRGVDLDDSASLLDLMNSEQ